MTNGEHFEEIVEDLQSLLNLDFQIISINFNGDKSSVKVIKKVRPKVLFQRRLIHISQMCRIWMTSNPKPKSGFELKQIAIKSIILIPNINDSFCLLNLFNGKRNTGIILTKNYIILKLADIGIL